MTLADLFLEAVERKLELADIIYKQMQPLYDANIISQESMGKIKLAQESLKACKMRLSTEPEDAIYLFSRGCWNLGEGIGRGRIERDQKSN
jgi:hypothetical protein